VSDSEVCGTHRRYLFLKYRRATLDGDENATVWDSKRRTVSGTTLPTTTPAYAALIAAGYLATEEVQGAPTSELIKGGLTSSEAAAVVAAFP